MQNLKNVCALNCGVLSYYLKKGTLTSFTVYYWPEDFVGVVIDFDNKYKTERKMEFHRKNLKFSICSSVSTAKGWRYLRHFFYTDFQNFP